MNHTITNDEVKSGGLFEFNITIGSRPGDVDDDGHLTTAGAVIVLRMAVRGEYSEMKDVSGDKAVTSLDALMILQNRCPPLRANAPQKKAFRVRSPHH